MSTIPITNNPPLPTIRAQPILLSAYYPENKSDDNKNGLFIFAAWIFLIVLDPVLTFQPITDD